MGTDSTAPMTLKPGMYLMRIENRFLGEKTFNISLLAGQTGVVTLEW